MQDNLSPSQDPQLDYILRDPLPHFISICVTVTGSREQDVDLLWSPFFFHSTEEVKQISFLQSIVKPLLPQEALGNSREGARSS